MACRAVRLSSMKASKPNGNIMGGNAVSARPFVVLSGMHWILHCGKTVPEIDSTTARYRRQTFSNQNWRVGATTLEPVDNLQAAIGTKIPAPVQARSVPSRPADLIERARISRATSIARAILAGSRDSREPGCGVLPSTYWPD